MRNAIKALRQENYNTQSISMMIKKLKAKTNGNDKFIFENTGTLDNQILSTLSEVEGSVRELIEYIDQLLSKRTKI